MIVLLLLWSILDPPALTVTWLGPGRVLVEWTSPGCVFIESQSAGARGMASCDTDGSAIFPDEAVQVGVSDWQPTEGDVFWLGRASRVLDATLGPPPQFVYLPTISP